MEYLFRSMLFLPAHNSKFLGKAATCGADAVIFDLEDAVPAGRKEEARKNLEKLLETGVMDSIQSFVRVNELGSETLEKELDLVRFNAVRGFVIPKTNTREDMEAFDRLVSEAEIRNSVPVGRTKLLPLIETAEIMMNIQEAIKGSARIIALLFGGEDYLDSIWGKHLEPTYTFNVARAIVVMAARMNNILPIDTPYLDLQNREGFLEEGRQSSAAGFAGALLITPRQIPWANECYSPSEEEIAHARNVLNAVKECRERGDSIAKLDGKMIGPPMRKRAEKVIEIADAIKQIAEQYQK